MNHALRPEVQITSRRDQYYCRGLDCSASARFFAALCQSPIICRPYIIYIFLSTNNAAPKIPKKFVALCDRTCLPPALLDCLEMADTATTVMVVHDFQGGRK